MHANDYVRFINPAWECTGEKNILDLSITMPFV